MTISPTQPPVLPPDVFGVGRVPVLVTGASGVLGQAVVAELNASLVPSRGFTAAGTAGQAQQTFRGDITTGSGLDRALKGIGAVIHCATGHGMHRAGVNTTRNLLDAMTAWAPQAHVVHLSVVGCWENPLTYYRINADMENIVGEWPGRSSIVRTTEFHDLVRLLASGPLARLTGASSTVRTAPVDPTWVATKLVDVALMRTPLPRPLELAGPETLSFRDLATLSAHLEGRRPRRALPLPTVGGVLTALARGSNLPGPETQRGGHTYAQWLAERLASSRTPAANAS